MNVWTDERIEKLKELWPTMPASEIAKILGVTRNAIIGKANRLGLVKGRVMAIKKVVAPKAKNPATVEAKAVEDVVTVAPITVPEAPVDEPAGVSLFDPRHDLCRWVIGDPGDLRCCGDPVSHAGGAWCSHHRAIVYARPRKRDRSKLSKYYR